MNWLKMVFIGVLKKSLLIIFIPGKSAFCLFTKRSHKIYLCEFTVVWGLLINIAESENWLCQFTENGCSSLIAVYVSSQETSQWTRMLIEQFIDQKCNGQEIWTLRYQTILWTERYMKFRLCSEEVFLLSVSEICQWVVWKGLQILCEGCPPIPTHGRHGSFIMALIPAVGHVQTWPTQPYRTPTAIHYNLAGNMKPICIYVEEW